MSSDNKVFTAKFEGSDLGLTNWVAEKLCGKSEAEFVSSDYDHPLTGNPVLCVEGEGGKKLVADALKEMREEISVFRKSFKRG